MKYIEEYQDSEICKQIIKKIKQVNTKEIQLMEVCGSHTMSIFKHGIPSVLPKNISLISGPGCPVCVTSQGEIDAFIRLSQIKDVIITTFGDLIRVPGTVSSLQKERANGKDIRIVYSPLDSLDIAKKNPDKKIVFLGIGFETTAPVIAGTILLANQMKLNNYFVFSAHKIMPPVLFSLMKTKEIKVDGFILPGNVSVIIGEQAYIPFVKKINIPSVITGFEPLDILHAVFILTKQIKSKTSQLLNIYKRVVAFNGNVKAQKIINHVFEIQDTIWRGLGKIPKSGLFLKNEFQQFDARKQFNIDIENVKEPSGCLCGLVITGIKKPNECPLYKTICTPMNPKGPCMVSSEGSCSAYYKYRLCNP